MKETKAQIVSATETLLRQYGYNGTSLKQITQLAGAPVGSVYHFFPGGKVELAAEVVRQSGTGFRQHVESVLDSEPSLAEGVFAVFALAGQTLEAMDFIDICPIGGIARETASSVAPVREAAEAVFRDWIDAARVRFEVAGLDPMLAGDLAALFVAALEGSFTLARTLRSRAPLAAAGRLFRAQILSHQKSSPAGTRS